VKDRIAVPLEMHDACLALTVDQRARLAAPHRVDGKPATNWTFEVLAGAGGIRSSVNDTVKFVQAQLDPPAGELGKALELA
jgi:CubicO group peptidase (beta-lactamase class C family)